MTNQHPVIPSSKLIHTWTALCAERRFDEVFSEAAKWGADQELDACCEWLEEMQVAGNGDIKLLRATRRPKPPSLAEEALIGLEMIDECAIDQMRNYVVFDELLTHKDTIRRALKRLQELEGADE